MNILERLSHELNLPLDRLEATVALLDDGNTVPFVARYRKEVTGGLDDTVLRTLCDRLTYLRNLEKRKEEVRALIEAQQAGVELVCVDCEVRPGTVNIASRVPAKLCEPG